MDDIVRVKVYTEDGVVNIDFYHGSALRQETIMTPSKARAFAELLIKIAGEAEQAMPRLA